MSEQQEAHGEHLAHVVPVGKLVAVWVALMILTGVTVGVAQVEMGDANIWVAMGIATLKAALVALFFMHLWWDNKFNSYVLLLTLFFLAVFVGLVLVDTQQYYPHVDNPPRITGKAK